MLKARLEYINKTYSTNFAHVDIPHPPPDYFTGKMVLGVDSPHSPRKLVFITLDQDRYQRPPKNGRVKWIQKRCDGKYTLYSYTKNKKISVGVFTSEYGAAKAYNDRVYLLGYQDLAWLHDLDKF